MLWLVFWLRRILPLLAALAVPVPGLAATADTPPPARPPGATRRMETRVVIPDATLNGQPIEMFLDTGSDSSLLMQRAVNRFGVKTLPAPRSQPASPGTLTFGLSEPVAMALNGKTFQAQFPVSSLPELYGLIGWPEIRDNILVFDSAQRVVRAVSELPKETATMKKFKLGTDSVLTFQVPLPSGKQGIIMVDTGAYHGVALAPARWQQWRDAHPQTPTIEEPYEGISLGTGVQTEAHADTVSLGAFSLTDVMVGNATNFEATNFDNYVATFGLEALARLDLIVDGKKGDVYLRPKPAPDASQPAPPPAQGRADWTLDPSVTLNLDSLLYEPAWYYSIMNNYADAATAWAKTAEKFPDDETSWAALGWARSKAGDAAGAATAFQKAFDASSDTAGLLRSIGEFLQTKQDNVRAILNYDFALALDASHDPVLETRTLDTTGPGDEDQLNQLGRDGWDLAHWNTDDAGKAHYVFQRSAPAPSADSLKITSATFGTKDQTADVTSVVAQLLQPGHEDIFVNEKWLGSDPAPKIIKTLKVDYEYAGTTRKLTLAENEALSRDILLEDATGHALPGPRTNWEYTHDAKTAEAPGWFAVAPATPPPADAALALYKRPIGRDSGREIKILSAYYGLGGNFTDVTALIADNVKQANALLTIGPDTMNTDPRPGLEKFLLVTYTLGGVRQHYVASDGGAIGGEILLEENFGHDAYARLYRQVLQMLLGQPTPDFAHSVATWPQGWARTLGLFVAGMLDEKALFAAAQTSDIESVDGQLCEAYYFAGMLRLIHGDQNAARLNFQKSLATGIEDYNEYQFSQSELARLDSVNK